MASENNQKPQDKEQAHRKREEQARRARRRSRQLLGVVLSVLIIWGAVSIVQSSVRLVQQLTDDTAEKLAYQDRIQLFVVFDVLPFESVSQLDDEVLKQLAIWGVFYEQQSENTLQQNEYGESLIAATEVDRWAQNMFGPTFQFGEPHGTFYEQVQGMTYEYLPDTDTYVLPITGLESDYLPSVVEISRMADGYRRVTVGYVAARGATGVFYSEPDYEHPVRYMDYIFRRDGSAYYLERLERNTNITVTTASDNTDSSVSVPDAAVNERDEASSVMESDTILQDASSQFGDESISADETTSLEEATSLEAEE